MNFRIAMILVLHLMGGTCLLSAQQSGDSPSAPAPATQEAVSLFEKLEADFNSDVKKARIETRRQMEETLRKIEAAKEAGEPLPPMPAMRMGPPTEVIAKHLLHFEAAAAKYRSKPEALPFLIWILRQAPSADQRDTAIAALEAIEADHLKSPGLIPFLRLVASRGRALGQPLVEAFLRRVEKEHPLARGRARAILERVRSPLARAPISEMAYQYARGEALRAAELSADKEFRAEVQSIIDGREKLIPGKVAPDISGVDLDGVAFKLSDYRGKIILLDFWGDW